MDKVVRQREVPCALQSRLLYKRQVVRGAMLMSMEIKSDQEAKEKQIKE